MEISKLLFTSVDLIIFYMVCSIFFDKRNIKNKLFYLFIAGLILSSFLVIFFVSNLLLKYVILTIVISVMMNMIFEDNILSICLIVILVYGLFFIIDYALFVLIETHTNVDNFMVDSKNVFVVYILSRLVCILLISTISLKKNKIILENKYTYKFILMSFLTIAGLISLIIPSEHIFITNKYLISSILIFNILFIYYTLKNFVNISNKLKIKSISEERANNELKLWQKLNEKDVVQRKIMHDYSNTLICIKGLLEQNDYEGVKDYVENISVEYKLSKSFVKTGNNLLDVLINTKYEKATENSIVMILKLDKLINMKVKNQDLIVLISNLLDNAIEYTLKLDKRKREIFFSINNGEKLEIMIRNPLESKITVVDDLVETTKEDKDFHGLGLLNIKEIIEKYKGEHYIDVDEGYFTHYIEI